MTAKTCGTCDHFKKHLDYSKHDGSHYGACVCPLPISLSETLVTKNDVHELETGCQAHTERESFCEWQLVIKYPNGLIIFDNCKDTRSFFTPPNYCLECGKPIKINENEK